VHTLAVYFRSKFHFFNWYQSLVHSVEIYFVSVIFFFLLLYFDMTQTRNYVPAFDGMNYGYWKVRMRFFLKSIDCWIIAKTGWTKPENAALELVPRKNARLSNDKALHTLCQALSPSELAKISNCESAKEVWQILETTYESIKLVKSAKLQMLISKFEEIKMLEEETFGDSTPR
jgi:hypothetical protein